MSFPRDAYPYTNFHELNLGYFIVHFREIFSQWADLYDQMLDWKDSTDEELATWKAGVEADLDQREAALRAELETWKAQTGQDIAGWEDATLAALTAWQTATQAVFEAIRVEAAGSATAAAASATQAATAKTAAETAQAAAEAAAASIASSAAQIATNTADISDLKTHMSETDTDIEGITGCRPLHFIEGKYIDTSGETADITALLSNSGFRVCVTPVSEGNTFLVNITGSTIAKAWAFIDSEGNILSVAGTNVPFVNRVLTAPADSAYLILNDMNTYGVCITGTALINRVANTETYTCVINVSRVLPISGFYTLQTAIESVYDNIPSARKGGIIITFIGEKPGTSGTPWVWTYQLQSNANTVSSSDFKNARKWVLINREAKTTWVFAAYDSTDEAKTYADYVATENDGSVIQAINSRIQNMISGGRIYLRNGTYYSSDRGINILNNNISIEGESLGVVIQRGSGNAIFTQSVKTGIQLANLTVASPVSFYGDTECIVSDCYINGEYIDTHMLPYGNILEVGDGRQYKTLSEAYAIFSDTAKQYNKHDRWEIHVYGHIIETAALTVKYNYIDIVGHNALIEFRGNKDVRLTVGRDTANYDAANDVTKFKTIKNIHFLKTGCYNYWNSSCVHVTAPDVKFYDCTFENRSSSPSPFDQADYPTGGEDYNGSRRHGCTIYILQYGNNCITEFHNCIGIGSPYGFQNTRGFYIQQGSPKLFDCVGYGGGIGVYGHGIINHRASKAELYNCVGYGSKWGYREAAGLRFQAGGSAIMVGCIGFGGNGEKHISNGVSADRITEICAALEIDPTPYVTGDTVNYSALTDEICAEIKNEDVQIVPLGSLRGLPEYGYGISFWANNGKAKLDSCIGYCGNGPDSYGLHMIGEATPTIIGGYYGVQDKMLNVQPKNVEGTDLEFRLDQIQFSDLNEYTPYEISRVCVSIGTKTTNHDLFYLETEEATPQTIINGFDLYNIPSIAMMTCDVTEVPAGTTLKAYVKRNGSKIEFPATVSEIHITFNFLGGAVYIGENADPIIQGAKLNSSDDADIMVVDTTDRTVASVRMYDCSFNKAPDNNIAFAVKTAINGSSNFVG